MLRAITPRWPICLGQCGWIAAGWLLYSGRRAHRTLTLNEGAEQGDPFALLRSAMGEPVAPVADVPFAGGALGYWGYGLAPDDDADIAQAVGSCRTWRWASTIGRLCWIIGNIPRAWCRTGASPKRRVIPQILLRLQSLPTSADTPRAWSVTSNFTPASRAAAFASVCIARAIATGQSRATFQRAGRRRCVRRLCVAQLKSAPYAAFLVPQAQILCASPECFVSVQNGGKDQTDQGHAPAQRANKTACSPKTCSHPKDRAENLMIVDLLRNDLGKAACPVRSRAGIQGGKFCQCASSGQLCGRPARGRRDAGRARLPGGSVTVAPKLRAMQIIEQLEPDGRGIYCGAIGYVGTTAAWIAISPFTPWCITTINSLLGRRWNRSGFGFGSGIRGAEHQRGVVAALWRALWRY